jgi:RNase P subunit RPR2
MKTAHQLTDTVLILCPECGEEQATPHGYGPLTYRWNVRQIYQAAQAKLKLQCHRCEAKMRISHRLYISFGQSPNR